MYKNRIEVTNLRSQVKRLRLDLEALQRKLNCYKTTDGYNQDVIAALSTVEIFFRNQLEQKADVDPLIDFNEKSQQIYLIQTLNMKETLNKQKKTLENMINDLKNQIANIFKSIEKDEHSYTLHAICVHEANPYDDHYYNYIKDHRNNKWRKFKNTSVSEVDAAEVFKSSYGGFANRTAFWVVYIDNEQLKKAKDFSIYDQV